MNKTDWYKLFAVGIVLVFVLEGIAIGVLQNSGPGNGGAGTSGPTLTGTAITNITIVRYEAYLIVSGGNADGVEKAKERLIASGAATYAVPKDKDLIVNLRSGKEVPAAAREFESANATVLANALVSTAPRIKVDSQDLSASVDGTSFNMQLRPIFDEGAWAEASFVAYVENGILAQLGNFAILPAFVEGALVQAQLVGSGESEITLDIPWENRSAAKPIAIAQGAAYREKSYIQVELNATDGQLSAIRAAGRGYVTGVQQGIVSVQNGFVDKAKAEQDFAAAGLQATFPSSNAFFLNDSENRSAALAEKLNSSGIPAVVSTRRTLTARLPEFVEQMGKKYRTNGILAAFEQEYEAENNTVYLELSFQAEGSTLSRLVSARQARQPSAG